LTAFFKATPDHPLATPLPIATPEDRHSGLDPGIGEWVNILRSHGVETFESCEGGDGHAYLEPTIAFGTHASPEEGWHALSVALCHGLPVRELRLAWEIYRGTGFPCSPRWELVFRHAVGEA